MKKILCMCLTLFIVNVLSTQSIKTYSSGHYSFSYPETIDNIENIAKAFNLYWNAFNEVFHFNPDYGIHQNKVVILENKSAFDVYISSRIGEPKNEYLFLKYQNPDFSELVLYFDPLTNAIFPFIAGPSLNRQLFLQFLYSFIAEPPLWVRDGFQAYFENLEYDQDVGSVKSTNYSAWLESAKNLQTDQSRKLDAEKLLSAITGTYETARFYPQAWAFAAFLLNTEKSGYQRFLFETSFLLESLSEEKKQYNKESQQENTDRVINRFIMFNSFEECNTDFSFWLSFQYTFAELLQKGVTLYNEGKYAPSRLALSDAIKIKPDDPMTSYYMGLNYYAEKNYVSAEEYYRISLKKGAEIATVNWALGLNAYADKRFTEARVYMETAKSINPARYEEKANKLLNSIPK